MTRDIRVNTRNRHKDSPRNKPYWKEDLAHHPDEANEKVRIHAIDFLDVLVVRFDDC